MANLGPQAPIPAKSDAGPAERWPRAADGELLVSGRPLSQVVDEVGGTPCYLYDGVFIGLTASRAMRNTMLLAFAGYLVVYFTVGFRFGNDGLWLSLLAFLVLRGVLQHGWYRRYGLALR